MSQCENSGVSATCYSVMRRARSVSCDASAVSNSVTHMAWSVSYVICAACHSVTCVAWSVCCVASVVHYSVTPVAQSMGCCVNMMHHSLYLALMTIIHINPRKLKKRLIPLQPHTYITTSQINYPLNITNHLSIRNYY